MIFSGHNVARVLERGYAAAAFTSPYDGCSVVTVDDRGMVNSLLPIGRGEHDFALGLEVGGRAMNLLSGSPVVCAHGLVRAGAWTAGCDCGIDPVGANAQRCETCENGCECVAGSPGCGHYGCWGVVADAVAGSCPAAVALAAEMRERWQAAVAARHAPVDVAHDVDCGCAVIAAGE